MGRTSRIPVIAGNWKMYKTMEEATTYVKALIPLIEGAPSQVCLAVPFTDIRSVAKLCQDTSIWVGAQNMHDAAEGAFTGEIAGRMLTEAGARFVLLGHSERRRLFGETNDFINKKVKRAIGEHLLPILCIGETAEEREKGMTAQVLATQLERCLANLNAKEVESIYIAYEPVWAIGSSKVATPDQAQEAHLFCREKLKDLFGEEAADKVAILYGGSVSPNNAQALLDLPDVDGVLVGTASLTVENFSKIVHIHVTKHLKLSR